MLKFSLAAAMLLATSSLQAAESAAKVVDVKIPLNSYMEGLQN